MGKVFAFAAEAAVMNLSRAGQEGIHVTETTLQQGSMHRSRKEDRQASLPRVFDPAPLPFVLVAALLFTANILMATQIRGRSEEATLFSAFGAAGMPMPLWSPQYCRSAGAKASVPRLVRADLVALLESKLGSAARALHRYRPAAPQRVMDRTIFGKMPDAVVRETFDSPARQQRPA